MLVSNYELEEQIAETPFAAVYSAYHKDEPDHRLVLKIFKSSVLSPYQVSGFQQKIEHLKVLNDSLVITPRALGQQGENCYVIQDYFDGITLDKYARQGAGVSLEDFFTIACGLAQALAKVHDAGIIHGGIKPHNILVDPGTLDIRIIDFISALDVRDVSHFIYDGSFVRETLSYTSPEQTGRINHRVVFSSDLYSLGVIFYEMLTGRLPYFSDDPLELIHSHLAEEAPAPDELNTDIPLTLSRIVAKLLFKQPEKRYQSSNGLLSDLLRCRDEYAATRTISEFPLESHVYTHRVTFISKMVGRDAEAAIILSEYEKVAAGSFRAMLISGLSGIGKTRLIQELQGPIVRHRGYFTSGKFDVYQKNVPYSSLLQALRHLIRTFLTESDARVADWRDRILEAVGDNGRVLTDVVPELEILIGPQPEIQPLPPVESLNRFHDLFGSFLNCLASRENPLVLFIDDLQWCDAASFDFLGQVFANQEEHPFLFLLGAYRHNEVDSSHPLMKLVQSVREKGWPLEEIRLGPLKSEHCHEMVSYILDAPLFETRTLSDFIFTLTEGNPLFVSESLAYLHNEDLLFFSEEGQWKWDIGKIRRSDMPPTIVDLFSSKIHRLPPDLVTMLEYCACMGNTFSPTELSLIREMTLVDTFELLKPALGRGLLIESKDLLQFVHDKVQEAALFSIPEDRRRQIHEHIGEHLLSAVPPGVDIEKLENLFTIVSHLNLAQPAVKRADYRLSRLNYHAGNKALGSLATEAANEYFNLARELLPESRWDEEYYPATFKVYQKAAKTQLMSGNYEASKGILGELLDHAKTDLDKAECLAEQTTSLSSIGNFIEAVKTANQGLAFFDKAIPDDPSEADARRHRLMEEIASEERDVWDTILHMPFTQDRRRKIELAFYSELIPDLYMSGLVPQLYLSAAQSTQHCLAGGMDESVIYSFSIMGLQLGEEEQFEPAFKYEDLARDLSAKYPNTFGATRGMNGIVWCNMHSRSHPRDIVDYCLKSIQCGKNCGDLYNAGLSYGPLMWNLQVQGARLSAVEDYAAECLQFSKRYQLSFSVGLAEAMQAGWIAPMKNDYVRQSMEDKLAQWEADNHIASAGSYCVHMALQHYYFGEHEACRDYLEEVRRYLSGLTDNVLKRQWHVFRVLNALKLWERGNGAASQEALMAEIAPIVNKVETWAALGPLLQPYLAMLRAERERVIGDQREARNLYLDAIHTAHAQHYSFLEGYLNECLGNLLAGTGQPGSGLYFSEATRLFRRCGASRKEQQLIGKFPDLVQPEETPVFQQPDADIPARILPNLDAEYLMKSATAISAEMEQEALLRKIIEVLTESSGAQRGYLFLTGEGGLHLAAESEVAERHAGSSQHKRLDTVEGVCKAIVRYAFRTGEMVLLDDACADGPFKDNPETVRLALRSVLCLPVTWQSAMLGVLYLENRLSDGVFTADKVQTIELLTAQAAVSIENARLLEKTRATERELRASERALEDRANQLSDFLSIAAHELGLPATVIKGYSQTFLEFEARLDDEQKLEILNGIESAADRLGHMVDELLDASRIDKGRFTINAEDVDPAELVEESVREMYMNGVENEIIVRLAEDLPRVIADGEKLKQSLLILLQNAVKFSEPDCPVEVHAEAALKSLVFSVLDRGIGVQEEDRLRIFDRFYQVEDIQHHSKAGLGLGLSIAREILEAHGGGIWHEEREGGGSVFRFAVPLEEG